MAKAHLVAREQNLVSNTPCDALCGIQIENAKVLYLWDEAEMGTLLSPPRGICAECGRILPSLNGPKYYIYGVTEAKRLRVGESE